MPNIKVLNLAENLLNSLEIAIIQNLCFLVIFANPLHHLQFQSFINPFPARGFVNSISSSTTCFSVTEELFDGIA